jgi:hypothetical protein
LTLASAPTGLQLVLNGATATAPATSTVIAKSSNTISAPTPQTLNGTWQFSAWSDGGAQTHAITAPVDATYTATFQSTAEDKALNHPANASSTYGAGFEPAKAVDGTSATRWSSTFSDGQWWEVDLGASRNVDTVVVNWENAYASTYRISTATRSGRYTTVTDVTISSPGSHSTSFTSRQARWIRITGLTRATAFGISFWDVNVFGPPDT